VSHKFFTEVKALMTSTLIRQSTKFEARNPYCSQGVSRKFETMTKIPNALKAKPLFLNVQNKFFKCFGHLNFGHSDLFAAYALKTSRASI